MQDEDRTQVERLRFTPSHLSDFVDTAVALFEACFMSELSLPTFATDTVMCRCYDVAGM